MLHLEILVAPDPVDQVHGVGPDYAKRLAKANITTAGELALAGPAAIMQALEISEAAAKELIAQARDFNNAIHLEGLDRAAALLLVKGFNLRTPQALSQQKAAELNRKLQAVSRQEMPSAVKNI